MIEFHNVAKEYKTRGLQRRVFSNLSFRIEPGESLAICGANGAGKSTFFNLISGAFPPSSSPLLAASSAA